MVSRSFVNTDLFRESALHFIKHGFYTAAPKGSKDYYDYWDEETRRCIEGYSVGGLKITGYHYFYLNFCRIQAVQKGEKKGGSKIETFPEFWDGDYNYFWAVEIARYGISPEQYTALGLDLTIREEDLAGGRHLVVLKARRKGYSYKSGSMMARHYLLGKKEKCYAMAGEKEFLINDGLLSKTFDNIDFCNNNTAWRQPFLIDRQMHKKSGYIKNVGGTNIEMGKRSEIIGVSLKDNPDKARGKNGELGFFEEAGKLPGLLKAWEVCRPSYEQGNVTTGLMIAFGTGGTEEADYEGLEKLFYRPRANNCLAIENVWDDGAKGTWAGFFIPATQNLEGFMDKEGNSDIEAATAFVTEQRTLKKESHDNNALEQYICEHPLTPQEATLQTSTNMFPTAELTAQLNRVKVHELYNMNPYGKLYRDAEGSVKFKPSSAHPPLYSYDIAKGDDSHGAVVIVEAPIRIGDTSPSGLYIICHDPYAHDGQGASTSIGSAYVLKMTNNFSHTLNDCIVASWVGRPDTQDDYNEQLFLLAEYYNAKIGFENDRGDVIGYAKRFKKLHYLQEEFQMLDKKELQSKVTSRPYGMHMTESRKNQGEIYIRDWLREPVQIFDDGRVKLRLHTIYDMGLLQELIKFNKKGNFDRAMSLMIGMYHMKELHNHQIVAYKESKYAEFFNRELF
jgi:hypothetical protein